PSLNHHQALRSNHCYKLSRGMNVIVLRIQGKCAVTRDQIAVRRFLLRNLMLMERRPRPEIVPAEISRQTEQIRSPFALGRTWLQDSVVNADILALGIQTAKRAAKTARAVSGGNLFENGRRLWQVLAQGIGQGAGA